MQGAENVKSGRYDAELKALYGEEKWQDQRVRLQTLVEQHEAIWGQSEELIIVSSPGRTELSGNHTDHNGGRILAASVDADLLAVAARTPDNWVRIRATGRREIALSLDKLHPRPTERRTSAALVRGVAAYLQRKGGRVGGFNTVTDTRVPVGSGLSSSAAFEVLMGAILNHAYNGGNLPYEWLALAGGHAENEYFDKPSGLMDQIACAAGGVVTVDFKDPQNPAIRRIPFDFDGTGYCLCMVDVGGNHSGLTDVYAAIPREMGAVANALGGQRLCDVSREQLMSSLSYVRRKCGDRAVLRALHFYGENERVDRQVAALEAGDMDGFLAGMLASGHSSFEYLQNIAQMEQANAQPMAVALCVAQQQLEGVGGWRVHGGGFGGCIQTLLPKARVAEFIAAMEKALAPGCCRVLTVRPTGSARIGME